MIIPKGTKVYISCVFEELHGFIGTIKSCASVCHGDSENDSYWVVVEDKHNNKIENIYFKNEFAVLDHTPADMSFEMMIEMAKQGILPAP